METVGDRMTSPVLSIEQDESVKNAAEKFMPMESGHFLQPATKTLSESLPKLI